MGRTEKFFKHSIAFKYPDEIKQTKLINIEWTMGRTGTLCPTAIFEPINLEGSIVQRASMHNVSVMKSLLGNNPYYDQKIWVVKKNLIIPQIVRAEKDE